jgi:hypothetical protein
LQLRPQAQFLEIALKSSLVFLDFARGLGGRSVVFALNDHATQFCWHCFTMLARCRYGSKMRLLQ